MKITKACDYAIRALIELSRAEEGRVFLRHELAEITNAPNCFLGKILQNLAHCGILLSVRGRNGGFRLGRLPSQITIYDIAIAVEGKIAVADCLVDTAVCADIDSCKIRSVWNDLQAAVTEKLKGISIEDLK
ncbi:MAG: Rrf2 family transcriptional regulator [Deferribacteraceae bacterium]|jgi:Rrf2 family protein|nr:Rrf2 family transcriptional regulator [Deferribacteraceae bacterium]